MMTQIDTSLLTLGIPLPPEDDRLAAQWRADAQDIYHHTPDEASDSCDDKMRDDDIRLLSGIISVAPHLHHTLTRLAKTHANDCRNALAGKHDLIITDARECFEAEMIEARDDEAVMRYLRHFRYRCYAALALSELAGHLTIEHQMKLLSDCAQIALVHCLDYLCQKSDLPQDRIVILALGKLGAYELNYSSDIDLIILYEAGACDAENQAFVSLTRELLQLFQKQTKEGFAWRVDLRLRPDPGATALALSCDAAISYYESIARSWERAVFIRARPIAGNLALGEQFLKAISPFIWRRQLDYSILSDLVAWVTHKPMPADGLGFDVKRGAYAIRHIEMMCHLLQILHGGREAQLRTHQTDKALKVLCEKGYLSTTQAEQSIALYWHWRCLEHRLQYCRDAHLYQMPNNQDEFYKFARFTGFADGSDLYNHLTLLQDATKTSASHPYITDMISAHQGALERGVWPADQGAQIQFLEDKGFTRAQDIIRTIESWLSGRHNATRSERARQTLQTLLPVVITELAKGDQPDSHFMGFAQFLEALPSGVQVFELLHQHPQLIELIAHFTLSAPSLMTALTKNPQIFEQMLDDSFFAPLHHHPDFSRWLEAETKDKSAEFQLDAIRLVAREAKFRAEAHILTYPDMAQDAHSYLSVLADACICKSFAVTISEFEKTHGIVPDSDFAVLLLGRAGQKQLTPQSDIDAIFLYDGDKNTLSDGPKPLSCGHYYQRLAARLVSWTSVQTASGSLYEIDTRLRPDGNAGPLATHFESWQSYLHNTAWPFEKLALHKARLLPDKRLAPQFATKIQDEIAKIISQPIARDTLVADITLLRNKLAAQSPHKWDIKKRAGGLLDCEFYWHLTGERDDDVLALYHKLTLLLSVMMPKQANRTAVPSSFADELCRLMKQSSFTAAELALDAHFAHMAQKLEKALSL